MRLTFLTGIWPPDVGGPATHGPEFAHFLVSRGHEVVVVTMGDRDATVLPCEVVVVRRSAPFPVRYSKVAIIAARRARRADLVYATATYAAAAAASLVARRSLVVKLVSDPAYERARRYGLFAGSLEDFQLSTGQRRIEALKQGRTRVLRRASTIVVPSAYLKEIAETWGLGRTPIIVLHNPAPALEAPVTGAVPGTFAMVGRLTQQKNLDLAIDAIAQVSDARLVVVGDGPDQARLERKVAASGARGRITFLGALPRMEAIRVLAGADACVISSSWENFPHAAVEALAVGVPVVATAVGGVPEIVRDGENGLLVAPGSSVALASALQRLLNDRPLRDSLAAQARPSVDELTVDRVYGRLEEILAEAARAA